MSTALRKIQETSAANRVLPYRDRARLLREGYEKFVDELLREMTRVMGDTELLDAANKGFLDEIEKLKLEVRELRQRPDPQALMQESRAEIARLLQRVGELTEENDGWIKQMEDAEARIGLLEEEVQQWRKQAGIQAEPEPVPEPAPDENLVGSLWRHKNTGAIVRITRVTGGGQLVVRVEKPGAGHTNNQGKQWHLAGDALRGMYDREK